MTTSRSAGAEEWRVQFLADAISVGALLFGSFTLKSGRQSPYFFNSGKFSTGKSFRVLVEAYASAICEARAKGSLREFDLIFGPAYKGIPLAAGVAAALSDRATPSDPASAEYPFAYNRKEAKAHGDGGSFVGAVDVLTKGGCRVLIVDDVLTAGTAVGEAIGLLRELEAGVEVVGVAIAFDREEVGIDDTAKASDDSGDVRKRESTVKAVERKHGIEVVRIAGFSDVVQRLERLSSQAGGGQKHEQTLAAMKGYREKYGAH